MFLLIILIIFIIVIILFTLTTNEKMTNQRKQTEGLSYRTCMQYYDDPNKCYWHTGGFDKHNNLFNNLSRFPAYQFKI